MKENIKIRLFCEEKRILKSCFSKIIYYGHVLFELILILDGKLPFRDPFDFFIVVIEWFYLDCIHFILNIQSSLIFDNHGRA